MKQSKILPTLNRANQNFSSQNTRTYSNNKNNMIFEDVCIEPIPLNKSGKIQGNVSKTNYEQSFKKTTHQYGMMKSYQSPDKIIQQIDTKLEQHKQDIEVRNDMITYIERTVSDLKNELFREKAMSEEKSKQIYELQIQMQAVQLKYKNIVSKNDQRGEDLEKQVMQLEGELKKMKDEEMTNQVAQGKIEQNLKQEIVTLNKKMDEQSQKNHLKESELTKKLQKLEQDKKQIENENLRLSQKEKDISDRLEREIKEKNSLKKQIDEIKNASEMKGSALSQEILNLNKKILLFTSEIDSQKLKMSKYNDQQKDIESKESEEIEKLNRELDIEKMKRNVINLLLIHQDQKDQKEIVNLQDQIKNLNKQNVSIQETLLELNKTLEEKSSQIKKLSFDKTDNSRMIEKLLGEQQQYKKLIEELEKKITLNTQFKVDPVNTWVTQIINTLESSEKEIMKSLICMYCKQFIKQPVTIIPCGHSYCLDCKKGYQKDCSSCGPKVKIEAMYRNELLDDIIAMVKIIQNSVLLMKQNKKDG